MNRNMTMLKKLVVSVVFTSISSASIAAFASDKVSILYFTDAHEISPVVDKFGDRGGVARLKAVIDQVKSENPNTIVTFGGDLAGGTLFGGVFKGFPIVEALNHLPVDVASFGQHDFDFGAETTKGLIANSHFPWITSNLTNPDGSTFAGLPDHIVIDIAGMRIAFLGLTDDMITTVQEGKVFQKDVVASARLATAKLVEQIKPDAIIALTQQSRDRDKTLLTTVPEISAVLAEEMSEEVSAIEVIEGKVLASPRGNIGSIIRLDAVRTAETVQISATAIDVDAKVSPEPQLDALAKSYQGKLDAEFGKTVLTLNTDLIYGEKNESRFTETNIGNLIADSFRAKHSADIAFMNGGGIRASVKAGEMTLKDAKSILPFGNRVVLAHVSGRDIVAALEHGVSRVDKLSGGFLQVSGLKYAYDAGKPVGSRVSAVMVSGKPILLDSSYSVAMPHFIFEGGDGYTMFKNSKALVKTQDAQTDVEVFVEYLRTLGVAAPKLEGRIIVIK